MRFKPITLIVTASVFFFSACGSNFDSEAHEEIRQLKQQVREQDDYIDALSNQLDDVQQKLDAIPRSTVSPHTALPSQPENGPGCAACGSVTQTTIVNTEAGNTGSIGGGGCSNCASNNGTIPTAAQGTKPNSTAATSPSTTSVNNG